MGKNRQPLTMIIKRRKRKMDKEEIKKVLETINQKIDECDISCEGPYIVVLHQGWIFKGNLKKESDNTYILTDCYNVRSWKKVGFGGLTKGAKFSSAILDKSNPIMFNEKQCVLKTPLNRNWENE
jgi:hypothetical protein